ncbi:autophagy protein 16 [Trichodelitschia bisporula]|uniref:Autophagy protein 16 n=1 Tax=Trichodelitschia bisporula TaxID=703511 RepID=A0A6G1HPA4_9PEZI|nr:autophagy protein 16 [Trichodelitschia bisporula]
MDAGLAEYAANIAARDKREQAQRGVFDLYTRLATRCAAAEGAARSGGGNATAGSATGAEKTARRGTPVPDAAVEELRSQLSAAQAARATLESQARAAAELQRQHTGLQARTEAKEREIALLARRLRDREEEIRERKKLVERVQDEMVALSLQLSMAEQKAERLEGENKDLVKRWMERVGEEVERMNVDSRW